MPYNANMARGKLALAGGLLLAATAMSSPDTNHFHDWARTPPMGWNSWDCFGTAVTEQQVLANAQYMADHLKKNGWNVVTVDIDWFVPSAKGWDYIPDVELCLDGHARVLPAPNRFPSAADGKGFGPLAARIHSMGLKLGVHLLRGIPRKAVDRDLPILGAGVGASAIANRSDVCRWNPDMYGVDMSKPGAQAYYDSLFELLASWGVDFVKVDDLSTPYHRAEIEAIRKAIDRCGRPMVFSTSPGPTGPEHGAHIETHANMWRISDDFWDNWNALKEQFERLDRWTEFRGPGHWPDADMLPLGAVRQGQSNPWTNFTHDEQVTLMSLWSIARSPLILGGDLPKNDEFTLKLLTNDEVLAVDQHSTNNRQLWRKGNQVAWVADVPGSRDKYVALINGDDQKWLDPAKAAFRSEIVTRSTAGQAVDVDIDVSGASKLYLYADPTEDGNYGDHVVWAEPRLEFSDGERKLTDLSWDSATQGYGRAAVNRSVIGKPLILNGTPVPFGIGTHAESMIVYSLPAGAKRFRAKAGLEHEGVILDHGATVRFMVFTRDPMSGTEAVDAEVPLDLAELGFPGSVKVRDLWSHRDLGSFRDRFAPRIPWHGAGLYRITP
jgi:hypothetical protein